MSEEPRPRSRARYLKQAEQAEAMAARANSPEERAAFEDIARLWRKLADGRPQDEI